MSRARSRRDEEEYLGDWRKKKFDELLCILSESESCMKPSEAEKACDVGTPIVFFDQHSFCLGLLNEGARYVSASNCIYFGPVYRFEYNGIPHPGILLLLRQLAFGRKYYEGDAALAVGKELYELIKERIHFDEIENIPFYDERSCEERWVFVETVLDYFGERRDDIGTKMRVNRVAEYFNNEDQEGPVFMESLAPREFLLAQKRLEGELERMVLGQEVCSQEDIEEAKGLLALAKNYYISTGRARELLLEKLGQYKGRKLGELRALKREIKAIERQKGEIKE